MLPKFSVKKPFTIMVGVIIIIVLGFISFTTMSTNLLPKMDLPYAIVSTTYVGASPEKIETTVTKPIEQSLATVSNVKNVSSVSSENSSMVIIEFTDDVNMDSALIELNSRLDLIKAYLPDEASTPTIMKLNPDMIPVMVTAIDIDNSSVKEISSFVSKEIIPKLEKTNGVATVSTGGLIEENIRITLNQEKIDNINNKILGNVDSELKKAQSELYNAQSKLEKGKKELENQFKSQTETLVDGSSSIEEGKNQLSNALEKLEITKAELEFSKKSLTSSLDLITSNENSLKNKIAEISSKEEHDISEIETLETLRQNLAEVENSKKEIISKISQLDANIAETENAKSELSSKKSELEEQEKQLEIAKVTLSTEISKASNSISSGEQELEKGKSEFESAKENAYDNASLDGIITQDMIAGILTAENFEMPAGFLKEENNQISVKVGEKFSSLDDIKNLTIFSFDIEGLENVTLDQLADIEFSDNSESIYAKVNGNNAILVTFQKQSTASTTNVSKDIKETIEKIENEYPNIHFSVLMDQGIYIDIVIGSVLENLLYGGFLAIIVLFIFLRDIRPTIIVALSIPISLTFAIALMYFTGVTINIISLSGLALGVGMLVDNSIVVIENIYRLRNNGKSVKEAAIEGASSVAGAIFASTLTTISVFIPIVFIQGTTKQLFMDMGLTIAYSLFASLIIALTLVPTMASTVFKKNHEKEHKLFDKFSKWYEKLLVFALKFKPIVLTLAVVLLFASVFWASRMGTEFIPEAGSNQMSMTVTMPKDSNYDDLKNMSNQIVDKMLTIDDIKTIGAIESSSVGLMSMSQASSTNMYIILKEDKKLSNAEIKNKILELTSDLNCEISVSTSNMDMSSMTGSGIEVNIKGNDLKTLETIANDITKMMENTDGLTEIDNGIAKTDEELKIIVDKNKAMKYGITVASVYQAVSNSISNEKNSTEITLDSKEYPIIVVQSDSKKTTELNLPKITLDGKQNQEDIEVELSEIATINRTNTLSSISHDNNQRYIKVTASVDSNHNIGLVSRDFEEKLKTYNVPNGYSVEIEGESETINNALMDLTKMIALAILLIYLIMVAQFQSLLSPFIIMFTIPLAFTGGFLALGITGTEISIIGMLGFLVLSGVVVNNGIVLIDYINQLRASGKNKKDAIIEAGKTRLRPILMTALTTILGLFTLALGIGSGAEMLQPMGIVTIGGLAYATLLTLLVVPCMYDIMNRNKKN